MMNKALTLDVEFQFDASQEQVWAALTQPELVKTYFFNTELVTDWQVGAPIFWRGEWDGVSYEDKGAVLAFNPNHFLKYNYWSSFSGKADLPENYAEISYTLEEKDGKTWLKINQTGLEDEEKYAHSESSWKQVMEAMAKMLEQMRE